MNAQRLHPTTTNGQFCLRISHRDLGVWVERFAQRSDAETAAIDLLYPERHRDWTVGKLITLRTFEPDGSLTRDFAQELKTRKADLRSWGRL